MKAVKTEFLDYATIAAKFNISKMQVSRIMKAHKSAADFPIDLFDKRAEKLKKLQTIISTVSSMRDRKQQIWRSSQVVEQVKSEHSIRVSCPFVSKVLRKYFHMRYKSVQKICYAGNSERSLALRCMCAKVLLQLLSAGKRLVNIDETWLDDTDMRK